MVQKYYNQPGLSDEEQRMVQEQLLGTHLVPRLGRPEEVADLVVYLASDSAAMINGTCIVIDGGTLGLARHPRRTELGPPGAGDERRPPETARSRR